MVSKEQLTGKAGEHRVISELMLRGFNPSITEVDDGVDCILDNGVKIQIKTSHLHKNGTYDFNFQSVGYRKGRSVNANRSDFKAEFGICWGIENNIFLVIPINELLNKQRISIGPALTKSKFARFKDEWDLLRGGENK